MEKLERYQSQYDIFMGRMETDVENEVRSLLHALHDDHPRLSVMRGLRATELAGDEAVEHAVDFIRDNWTAKNKPLRELEDDEWPTIVASAEVVKKHGEAIYQIQQWLAFADKIGLTIEVG